MMGWPVAAMLSLALATTSIGYQAYTAIHRDSRALGHQDARAAAEVAPRSNFAATPGTAVNDQQSGEERLQVELARSTRENADLQRRIATLEERERSATEEIAGLMDQLQEAHAANAKVAQESSERQLKLAALQSEVDGLRIDRAQTNAMLAEQQNQLKDLTQQLKSSRDVLTRREEMLAEGRDVRELMGARNLHIIDLYDADGRGRTQKTFGRVFYTEGKSLIFYAFDLDEDKLANAGFTYQAWGAREGQQGSVKRLGMLYVDDHSQKRWVLKVENPEQLAEIDSVFVTLERSADTKLPHGQKLLYAYLGSNANHP